MDNHKSIDVSYEYVEEDGHYFLLFMYHGYKFTHCKRGPQGNRDLVREAFDGHPRAGNAKLRVFGNWNQGGSVYSIDLVNKVLEVNNVAI